MLAGLAMKWKWKARRIAAGKPFDKPNIVFGSNVQVYLLVKMNLFYQGYRFAGTRCANILKLKGEKHLYLLTAWYAGFFLKNMLQWTINIYVSVCVIIKCKIVACTCQVCGLVSLQALLGFDSRASQTTD